MTASPAARVRENATEIAGTVATGVWLAALFTGQDWWLAALLIGYVVVVPIVALLFGDEEDVVEWWNWDGVSREEAEPETERVPSTPTEPNNRDALETLRDRYARGELTDEQFERKLDRLLDTETLEDVEDRERETERE